MNIVHLIGNLGADPEIRHTQDGHRIASLSLATNKSWKDKLTGERKEHTEWHRVTIVSDALAGVAQNYCKKGGKIAITGELRTRKWTDNNDIERYSTEIIVGQFGGRLELLDKREGGGTPPPAGGDMDDEIPF
ncbi:single-stranded DNA-binding protein [Emcibacter nanhaiensis]|uniref:Single-stranded DNA-binding protein n=1 Tax=Emcibacter nanhaiensis TaxID=1505037 RepID=A0A501PTC2_9PROT|nr:single-stranded DNA-binding protein [Emcibacter nanhaiensis]TPD63006.1 single-stranded DNA-binding protein [Emcibacter nanhaiensis]